MKRLATAVGSGERLVGDGWKDVNVRALQVQISVDMERQELDRLELFCRCFSHHDREGLRSANRMAAIVFSLVTVDFEGR